MNNLKDTGITVNDSCCSVIDSSQVKRLARRGAIWVTLTSAVAVPLAYYRNWILGGIGEAGEVIGNFALILLFIQLVVTFAIYGGSSVVTNFLPKIKREEDKSAFLFTYSFISLMAVLIFVALINLFPCIVSFLIRKPVDEETLYVFSFSSPIIVLSQLVIFSLAGLMEFRLSSVLNHLQLFFVCTLATVAHFFFSQFLQQHVVIILISTVCVANLIVFVIGSIGVKRALKRFKARLYLPTGFWRFSGFIHLNTVSTFTYHSIDQIFVLATLGIKELGAYFILLQCAQLINFVPQRIGQVMLASFSHLVSNESHEDLRRAYVKLCRIILIMSTSLALFIVLFSQPIAGIFGEWYADRHIYLVMLALIAQLGSLGSINSMLIMAKERTGVFLINSIVLISIQLVVTMILLDDFGIYAVIAGKAAASASAQIGLFSIIRWRLGDISLSPPYEYWIVLLTVVSAGVISIYWGPLSLVWAGVIFILLLLVFLSLIRFRWKEVFSLLNQQRHRLASENS